MQEKLLNYGFQEFQIAKLLKTKKIDTTHGIYTLEGSKLLLETIEGYTKEVQL